MIQSESQGIYAGLFGTHVPLRPDDQANDRRIGSRDERSSQIDSGSIAGDDFSDAKVQ
jgi:hypothetical protein